MKPTVTDRLDRLRAEFAGVWAEVVEEAPGMSREDLVAVCGAVQGLVNVADGAQLVAMGYAARFELRNTSRGLIEVTRDVGFVDEFAASEIAVETGVGVFASGRLTHRREEPRADTEVGHQIAGMQPLRQLAPLDQPGLGDLRPPHHVHARRR